MSDTIAIMCPACGVRMTVPKSGGDKPAAKTKCLRCNEVFAVGDGVKTATGAHPAPSAPAPAKATAANRHDWLGVVLVSAAWLAGWLEVVRSPTNYVRTYKMRTY